MIIIFADKKTKCGTEISDILYRCIPKRQTDFDIVTEYSENIDFPPGSIGVCEDSNSEALKSLMKNCVPVISCGMNGKNTVTLSSVGGSAALVSLQRTVTDIYGRDREPAEFRIRLTHSPVRLRLRQLLRLFCFSELPPMNFKLCAVYGTADGNGFPPAYS